MGPRCGNRLSFVSFLNTDCWNSETRFFKRLEAHIEKSSSQKHYLVYRLQVALFNLGLSSGASQVALVVKEPTYKGDVRDMHLIPGLGKSPGGGHGSPLHYSCLEKSDGQSSLAGYSS